MEIVGKKPIILTGIYSVIMFFTVIVNIVVYNYETTLTVYNPLTMFGKHTLQALLILAYLMMTMLFVVLIIGYGKTNLKVMLIPMAIPILLTLAVAFYSGLALDEWDVMPNVMFRFVAYVIIFGLYALIIFDKFENKKILTIVCFALIFLSLAYFFAGLKPFVNGTTIYISKLLFFISYCATIASINMGMDKFIEDKKEFDYL